MPTPGGRLSAADRHRAAGRWRARLPAIVVPAAGAGIFLVLLPLAYRPAIDFDMNRAQDAVTRGFYPAESGEDLRWAWSGRRAVLILPGLDRRMAWRWTAQALVWRPPDVPMPQVTIGADGVTTARVSVSQDFQHLYADVPPRPDATGLTLTIDTDPPFTPTPEDARQLGVALTSMSLVPQGDRPAVPRPALTGGTLAVLGLGIALALMRLPTMTALGLIAIVAWVQAWTLTRGFAVYLNYPQTAAVLAAGFGLGGVALLRLVEYVRGAPVSTMARSALGLSTIAAYLKLQILLHPSMPIGDGLFHAHRLETVLGGQLYFTSIAPGEYTFPYPVLLYLAAAPFSLWTADTLERVALLRIVVTAFDAAAAMMLYWMIRRSVADARVAIAGVLWYHLLPATGWIMTWGNLTNAFAQAWFVASLALMAGLPADRWRARTTMLLSGVAAVALLGHPSAAAILVVVMATTALLYRWRGGPPLAGAARAVWFATLGAAALAVVLYYAWFAVVYVRELGRIATEVAASSAEPGSTLLLRASRALDTAPQFFGWPGLMAALLGLALWDRLPMRLRLLLLAWGGACAGFIGLGLVTPIELRAHYAAFPAVALLAACGSIGAWDGPRPLGWCMVALLVLAAWVGASQWAGLVA